MENDVYFCPLLNEVICDGYCYDINMVAFGMCKPSLIDNIVNREDANAICKDCDNRWYSQKKA